MTYELLFGEPPFFHEEEDPYPETRRAIHQQEVTFPPHLQCSKEAKAFILQVGGFLGSKGCRASPAASCGGLSSGRCDTPLQMHFGGQQHVHYHCRELKEPATKRAKTTVA